MEAGIETETPPEGVLVDTEEACGHASGRLKTNNPRTHRNARRGDRFNADMFLSSWTGKRSIARKLPSAGTA
jgi:hypothetical protein